LGNLAIISTTTANNLFFISRQRILKLHIMSGIAQKTGTLLAVFLQKETNAYEIRKNS